MTPRCLASFAVLMYALSSAQSPAHPASPVTPQEAPTTAAPMPTAPMSKETRLQVFRVLNAELVYIRAPFPMGEKGLHLRNGVVTPSGDEMRMMIATFGPAAKPGDQARISSIVIRDKSIIFEINGGPRKKGKWYQHISISGSGGGVPIAPSDQDANARGSFVELHFDHRVPDLTPAQLKTLLRPVFDFDAKSPVDAYLETVSPKVKEAIKNHQVLVGMNREMVTYSKGRAEKKIREKDGEVEYEEWIYGEPPHDVEFVRLVGDEVVQMKTMKIDGERIVRTEKEVDLAPPQVAAKDAEKDPVLSGRKPTLRRPGEQDDTDVDVSSGSRRARAPNSPGGRPRTTDPSGDPPVDPKSPPNFLPGY